MYLNSNVVIKGMYLNLVIQVIYLNIDIVIQLTHFKDLRIV